MDFLNTNFFKIANKKLISKLFVRHSSGDKRRNERKKNLIDFVIKLNEDDWMFERSVTTRNLVNKFHVVNKLFLAA